MATKAVEKWKAKKWFNVFSPKLFGEVSIGEIPADDEKKVVGRVIKVNMSWITKRPEHSFMVVGLRVAKVNGEAVATDVDYIEQTYSYIHSLVKRHSSVIYTVDRAVDRSGKPFTLKLVLITDSKLATPKKSAMRRRISEFVRAYATAHSVEELMNESLTMAFQREGINQVKNIGTVARLEVKKIEL